MKLPNGDTLYRVVTWNGTEILMRSSKRVGEEQEFWIFDKKFIAQYERSFYILLTEKIYGTYSYVFEVETITAGNRERLGMLSINVDGGIVFNGKHIECDRIKRSYNKAVVLYGGS